MKKLLLLLSFLPLCIWGNEGMWLPCCLSKQTQQVMKEMGLELSSEQLYNPGGKALANAVVSFGGFCSGVVVSPDGLVFTNHHCGYDAIQQHSSVEHDYLRDGFVADSLSKELPNPDLFVSFLIRTEDVTERVLQAIPVGTKENDRALIVDSISTLLAQEAVANDTLLRAEITPFYGGNVFHSDSAPCRSECCVCSSFTDKCYCCLAVLACRCQRKFYIHTFYCHCICCRYSCN